MSRAIAFEWPRTWQFQAGSRIFEPDEASNENDSPDRARWVLALGIISLVIGPLGIYAWMAGNACLKMIADGRLDPTCEANARAGRILGFIAICMFTFKVTVLLPLAAYIFFV